MEEFRIAHEQVVNGRKKFLIPVLLEDVEDSDIPDDLRLYLDTYTYLEVNSNESLARKKLRYAMPKTPLRDLKRLPPQREYKRIRSSVSQREPLKRSYSGCSETDDDEEHTEDEANEAEDEECDSDNNMTDYTDLPSPSHSP